MTLWPDTSFPWAAQSVPCDDLQPEIVFLLRETIFIGDPSSAAEVGNPAFQARIERPEFSRRDARTATTVEAAGHEAALAEYYRALIARRAEAGWEPRDEDFWLRLMFFAPEGAPRVGFSWYDSLSQMRPLLRWLQEAEVGQLFCDMDYEWRFTALRRGEVFHFLQDDPQGETSVANVVVPRGAFLERIEALESRVTALLTRLSADTGVTVWN